MEAKFNHQHTFVSPLIDIKIYPLKYMLLGLTEMRVLGTREKPLSFEMFVSQEPTDVLTLVSSSTSVDLATVQYLFLGNNMMMACIECMESYILHDKKNNRTICVAEKECPEIINEDEIKMYHSCRQCSVIENMLLVEGENGKKYCECAEGYTVDTQTGRCKEGKVSNAIRDCPDQFEVKNK